eukprot:6287412-Alexandrium_andersonii.AAC.1
MALMADYPHRSHHARAALTLQRHLNVHVRSNPRCRNAKQSWNSEHPDVLLTPLVWSVLFLTFRTTHSAERRACCFAQFPEG